MKGQESVWDYPRPPEWRAEGRSILVQESGVKIAETTRSIKICETASPPTFYLPEKDVDQTTLLPCAGSSFCEWKGRAVYWATKTNPSEPIGWSYPDPSSNFAVLKNYYSFYPNKVECFLDGERVKGQPGGFYGGWVTKEIIGPYKGEPGTSGW